jgi:hypothetical protein
MMDKKSKRVLSPQAREARLCRALRENLKRRKEGADLSSRGQNVVPDQKD